MGSGEAVAKARVSVQLRPASEVAREIREAADELARKPGLSELEAFAVAAGKRAARTLESARSDGDIVEAIASWSRACLVLGPDKRAVAMRIGSAMLAAEAGK